MAKKEKLNVSVVIPAHEEPLLDWTIENVKRVEPGVEVIVMEDPTCRGVGIMRHEGILKATNDCVIIVDAHMDFHSKTFERMANHIKRNKKDLVCVDCLGLDEETLKPNDVHRYGADVYEVMPGGRLANPKIFVSKWRHETGEKVKTHAVPNILGGCYALSRDWYINGLGGVWQYHRGWGKSEQMIGLMNYYCGGRSVCIPNVWAAHLFRKHKASNIMFFKRNSMLLLHAFVPTSRREELLDTFCPGNRAENFGIKNLIIDGSIDAIQGWIDGNAVRSYADIKKIFSRAKPRANYAAKERPRNCPYCKSEASKVEDTIDIHRRKRVCLDCGNKFKTFSPIL